MSDKIRPKRGGGYVRLPDSIDVLWPYDKQPAWMADAHGTVILRQTPDGGWNWHAYAWGEPFTPGVAPTAQEVIDALLVALIDSEEEARSKRAMVKLGEAVAAVLPGALKVER